MRSGKLLANNDLFIEELINDSNYIIQEDGTILTLITIAGNRSVKNDWRKLDVMIKSGYQQVSYKNKKLRLHRILYRKFVGNLEKDLVINHKDGNRQNNHPSNLELVTQSENNTHRFQTLKHPPIYGNVKLSFELANQIREDKKRGLTHKQLMEKYKVAKSTISEIVNNKIWI